MSCHWFYKKSIEYNSRLIGEQSDRKFLEVQDRILFKDYRAMEQMGMTNCFLIDISDCATSLQKNAVRNLKKLQQLRNLQVIFYARDGCPEEVVTRFKEIYNRNHPKVDEQSFDDKLLAEAIAKNLSLRYGLKKDHELIDNKNLAQCNSEMLTKTILKLDDHEDKTLLPSLLNHDYLITGMTRADKFILLNKLRLSKLQNGCEKLITLTGSRMEDTFFMNHDYIIPVAIDPKSVVLYEKSRVVL